MILSGIDDVKLMLRSQSVGQATCPPTYAHAPTSSITKKPISHRRMWSHWSLNNAWALIGIYGDTISTLQGSHTDNFISVQVDMPLLRLLGRYMFVLSVTVETFPLDPWRFNFMGRGCAFARVVPTSDPFMVACRRGDFRDVCKMLENGVGRVSDMDERRWTPLAVSVPAGNFTARHANGSKRKLLPAVARMSLHSSWIMVRTSMAQSAPSKPLICSGPYGISNSMSPGYCWSKERPRITST